MIPGNPARTILGPQASAQDIAEMEIKLGLNKSKLEQYADYMIGILHGDFGTSYVYNRPVTSLIAERIPNTLVITLTSLVIAIFIGVGIGAFIHNWIPEDFIVKVLGDNNPFGVVIATIAGVPMYADIFGTIPIAEALLGKGALLGVVLAFMMGVTTLSLPSMIMLRKAVKPKLLGVFIAICSIGIIVVGYFFNAIQYLII